MSIRDIEFSQRYPVDQEAIGKIKGYIESKRGNLDKRILEIIHKYAQNILSQIQQEIPEPERKRQAHVCFLQPADALRPFSLSPEGIIAEVFEALSSSQYERIQRLADELIAKVTDHPDVAGEVSRAFPAFEEMVFDIQEKLVAIARDPTPSRDVPGRVAPPPTPVFSCLLQPDAKTRSPLTPQRGAPPRAPTPMDLDAANVLPPFGPSMKDLFDALRCAKMREDGRAVGSLTSIIVSKGMSGTDEDEFLRILELGEGREEAPSATASTTSAEPRSSPPPAFCDPVPPHRVRFLDDAKDGLGQPSFVEYPEKENRAPCAAAAAAPCAAAAHCDAYAELIERAQRACDSVDYEEMQRIQIQFQENPSLNQLASERKTPIFYEMGAMLQAIQASLQQP